MFFFQGIRKISGMKKKKIFSFFLKTGVFHGEEFPSSGFYEPVLNGEHDEVGCIFSTGFLE